MSTNWKVLDLGQTFLYTNYLKNIKLSIFDVKNNSLNRKKIKLYCKYLYLIQTRR